MIREVSKILTFYLHNNIINHGQFDEIKFRASQRLINLYVTNKPTILNTVKDYIIQVLRRDGIRPLIYKRVNFIKISRTTIYINEIKMSKIIRNVWKLNSDTFQKYAKNGQRQK